MARKTMNVLAIGSHPDDIEFGCAGTICKMAEKGHSVSMLVLTDGCRGGESSVRKTEQEAAAAMMKVKELFWGNFMDTRLHFYDNVIQEVEKAVAAVRPSFVYVHDGRDTHQDHRNVSECTVVATRNVPNVLFYEGPTTIHFSPNVYVDIRGFIDTKGECLACHKSQIMKTNIEHQSITAIARAYAGFRGTECRVPYAEAFRSLRMFILP